MSLIQLIGLSGSLLLCAANIPQAVHSIRKRNSNGLSLSTLLFGVFGLLFQFVYSVSQLSGETVLIAYRTFTVSSVARWIDRDIEKGDE
jgi:uncharacterized protein with PQ loop repeat